MKRLRQATVEPVLGTLVNFLGMRRVNTRGISLANKCLLMAAVCYNLKRLLKWRQEAKEEDGKTLCLVMAMLWQLPVPNSRRRPQIQYSLAYVY